MILAAANAVEEVVPHVLYRLGPFAFTNQMLALLVASGLMVTIFILAARDYPLVPKGLINALEMLLDFVRTVMARPVLGEHTDRFMPFLWTLFFFILINNLLGLIPLDAFFSLLVGKQHVFGTATASLSVTGGLAVAAFVMIHGSGILAQTHLQLRQGRPLVLAVPLGIVFYFYRIVPHVSGVLGVLLFPMLFVLELLGAVIKAFALAMRLYANMLAGHLVLATLLLLIPTAKVVAMVGVGLPAILGCIALSCLEVFVACLQAYIFVFLTCLFIGAAVNPEH